jgi:hypothetical protein
MPLDAWGLLLLPPILMAAWLTLILFDEPLRAFLSQRPSRGFRSQAPGKGVATGPSTLNLSGPAMGGNRQIELETLTHRSAILRYDTNKGNQGFSQLLHHRKISDNKNNQSK